MRFVAAALIWLALTVGAAAQCAGGISNCPAATSVNQNDYFVVSQIGGTGPTGYVTRKATGAQVSAALGNYIFNTDGSINISNPSGNVNISLNTGHTNTWTAIQNFSSGITGAVNGVNTTGTPSVGWVPTATSSTTAIWSPSVSPNYIDVTANNISNLVCDNMTDDTAALNTLISGIVTAGTPGVLYFPSICLISSAEITFPTSLGTPLRFTGAAITQYYGGIPTAFGGLNMTFNASLGKIDTRYIGTLEIDHMVLEDTGSDCAPILFTTNTALIVHDNAFKGTAANNAACNDAIIFGGTNASESNPFAGDAPFTGYGTRIWGNVFSQVRRVATYQVFANGILFDHNTIDNTAGTNETTAITAATNANPVHLTITGHGWPLNIGATATATKVGLIIAGATGNWTAINGNILATVVDANTVSIPVDSTSFGSLTGSPVFYSGAAFVMAGFNNNEGGNYIGENLVEMGNYAYLADIIHESQDVFANNMMFDFNSIAFIRIESTASGVHTLIHSGFSTATPFVVGGGAIGDVLIIDGSGSPQGNQLGANGGGGMVFRQPVLLAGSAATLGIGSIDPNSLININVNLTDPTAQSQALAASRSVSISSNNSNNIYGGYYDINLAANAFNYTGQIAGQLNEAASSNTGIVSEINGSANFVYNISTGTMTLANGVRSWVQNLNAGGTITTFNGFLADVGPGFQHGTLTNWNGFKCGTPPTATNSLCFNEPGTTPNFFGGITTFNTGIVAASAAPTVTSGQIGYGGTIVSAGTGNCPATINTSVSATQAVEGCIVVNIAGTVRNIPLFAQ